MTQQRRDVELGASGGELLPAGAHGSVREWAEQLVAQAREDGSRSLARAGC
jgi:hypothetical protein